MTKQARKGDKPKPQQQSGKGPEPKAVDGKKFREGYDRIFKNKGKGGDRPLSVPSCGLQ